MCLSTLSCYASESGGDLADAEPQENVEFGRVSQGREKEWQCEKILTKKVLTSHIATPAFELANDFGI